MSLVEGCSQEELILWHSGLPLEQGELLGQWEEALGLRVAGAGSWQLEAGPAGTC